MNLVKTFKNINLVNTFSQIINCIPRTLQELLRNLHRFFKVYSKKSIALIIAIFYQCTFTAWLEVFHHESAADKNEDDKRRWLNFAREMKAVHRINKTSAQCKQMVLINSPIIY